MIQHIIPEDGYNHIEDLGCYCNPSVTIAEGEEIIYHNFLKKLLSNQTSIDDEFQEIINKEFWNLI